MASYSDIQRKSVPGNLIIVSLHPYYFGNDKVFRIHSDYKSKVSLGTNPYTITFKSKKLDDFEKILNTSDPDIFHTLLMRSSIAYCTREKNETTKSASGHVMILMHYKAKYIIIDDDEYGKFIFNSN
jgi:hypothetical protein